MNLMFSVNNSDEHLKNTCICAQPCFTSKEFAEALARHQIDHGMISVEHPQANGLCERTNKTLLGILAACVGSRHEEWDSELERAVGCFNRAYQETTKMTPFELVFGRKPVNSENVVFPRCLFSGGDLRSFKEVEELRREAVERTRTAQLKQANHFNRNHIPAKPLPIGSLVLVRRNQQRKGNCSKFAPKFVGPFRIERQIGAGTYTVADVPGRNTRKRFHRFPVHVSQIKPFHSGYASDSSSTSEEDWMEDSDEDNPSETHSRSKSPILQSEPVGRTKSGRMIYRPTRLLE